MKADFRTIFGHRIICFDRDSIFNGIPFDTIIIEDDQLFFVKKQSYIVNGRCLNEYIENEKLVLGDNYAD